MKINSPTPTELMATTPDGTGEKIVVESRDEERDALGNMNDPTAMASINGEVEETVSTAPPQAAPPQEDPQATEPVMQADAEDSRAEGGGQNDAEIKVSHGPASDAPAESDSQDEVPEPGSHEAPAEGQNLLKGDSEEAPATVDAHRTTAETEEDEDSEAGVSADSDVADENETSAAESQTAKVGVEGAPASEDEGSSGDIVDADEGKLVFLSKEVIIRSVAESAKIGSSPNLGSVRDIEESIIKEVLDGALKAEEGDEIDPSKLSAHISSEVPRLLRISLKAGGVHGEGAQEMMRELLPEMLANCRAVAGIPRDYSSSAPKVASTTPGETPGSGTGSGNGGTEDSQAPKTDGLTYPNTQIADNVEGATTQASDTDGKVDQEIKSDDGAEAKTEQGKGNIGDQAQKAAFEWSKTQSGTAFSAAVINTIDKAVINLNECDEEITEKSLRNAIYSCVDFIVRQYYDTPRERGNARNKVLNQALSLAGVGGKSSSQGKRASTPRSGEPGLELPDLYSAKGNADIIAFDENGTVVMQAIDTVRKDLEATGYISKAKDKPTYGSLAEENGLRIIQEMIAKNASEFGSDDHRTGYQQLVESFMLGEWRGTPSKSPGVFGVFMQVYDQVVKTILGVAKNGTHELTQVERGVMTKELERLEAQREAQQRRETPLEATRRRLGR